ncbi:MAG: hypothetical protein AB7O97_15420 [Planctomycetota bacterium]
MHRALVSASALLLAIAVAPAQAPIRAFGTLRAAPAGGYTLQEIEAADVRLVAPGLDLRTFENRVVEVTGAISHPPGQVWLNFDVATIARATSWFACPATARLGGVLPLRIDTVGVSRWYMYFSPGSGHTPLEVYMPIAGGTLWLDPTAILSLTAGDFDSSWQDTMPVPNDPSLIGASFVFQGAIHTVPGPLLFLNAVRVTVVP